MTLEEIDLLLADWKHKLDVVGRNLIDLHGLSAYQRLCGTFGYPLIQLTGVTLARATPALQLLNELFQHFDLLVQTIDKAVQLRGAIPKFLPSPQKIQEVEDLLTKPSIHLSVVNVPLGERGLLSASQTINAIAPQELLQLMTSAFQAAKEVVLVVDEVWSQLEQIIYSSEAETQQLQRWAESLKFDCYEEIYSLSQKLAMLKTSIETDPLGVNEEFLKLIQPQILKLKTTLEQLSHQQKSIQENFIIARQHLANLLIIHCQAQTAFDESKIKVVDHSTLQNPLPQEEITALTAWLERLETKFNDGLFNPVRVGLENWHGKVKQYIAIEQTTLTANQAPLNTRAELRGRLDALQAKALARGLVEDPLLCEVAQQAKQLLFTRPTPLTEAGELVLKYEKKLNSYPNSR